MAVYEIFDNTKCRIDTKIRVLQRQHGKEVYKKNCIIEDLKQQIAELNKSLLESAAAKNKTLENEKETFSTEWLCQVRSRRGLDTIQMAKLLGVSHMVYSSWEDGRSSPNTSSIKAIARIEKLSDFAFWNRLNRTFPNTPLSLSDGKLFTSSRKI